MASKMSSQLAWVPKFIQKVQEDLKNSRSQGQRERMLHQSIDSLQEEYGLYKARERDDMDSGQIINISQSALQQLHNLTESYLAYLDMGLKSPPSPYP